MEAVSCTIPGEPMAYQRMRHQGKRHWKPIRHAQWSQKAEYLLRGVWGRLRLGEPWKGPLTVRIEVVFPRPKGDPKTKRLERQKKPSTNCDLDNVVKLVLDSAKAAGWMVDDRHVQRIEAERWHAAAGEEPSVTLTMWRSA